jgi:hypothetical protein
MGKRTLFPIPIPTKGNGKWENHSKTNRKTRTKNTMSFILYRSGAGLTEPHFQCDHCGRLINDARRAVLIWDDSSEDEKGNILPRIVCKGSCDDQNLPMSMELSKATSLLAKHYGIKITSR